MQVSKDTHMLVSETSDNLLARTARLQPDYRVPDIRITNSTSVYLRNCINDNLSVEVIPVTNRTTSE